jgi:PAS domain S-box-containing protein
VNASSPIATRKNTGDTALWQFVDRMAEYAMFLLDPSGHITSWNKGAERIKGWTAEEIIGQHFSILYYEADRAADLPNISLQRAAADGEYQECGYRVRKDGSRFFANVNIHTLYDENGGIIGYGKITRDITEKNETEIRLFASESRLHSLIETIVDGVITIDEKGTIQSYNQACVRLFGYDASEVLGHNVSMLMPDPYQSAHDGYISNYRKSGHAKLIGIGREVVGKRKDGSTFPMELAVGETHAGNEYAFVGIIRDITERKEAEKAREQLRQSQRMEAIGQLTGGIAHDFNNLLAIILGNLDFMQERIPKTDPLQEFIMPSISAAEHGSELTQQLLAFGRKQTLQPQSIEINGLLFYFTTFIRHMLGERIETRVSLPPGTWNVNVDANQLQNALINLSVNARDAMPEGGKLTFETSNVTFDREYIQDNFDVAAGDYVMVAVSDTGKGMDANTMSKAFEPFFTTKDVGKGTGLGLSMVYGFVKQSKGHIKLYSEPGFGTTVKIYLPRAETDKEYHSAPQQDISAGKPPTQRLILVVEDNMDVLKITSSMLESIGYQTITATSGDEAILVIKERDDIDLLLSDVMLPGNLNGPSLAQQAVLIRPRLKVLFNSGYAEQAQQNSGLLGKHVQIISKPFRKMQLAAKIEEIFNQ